MDLFRKFSINAKLFKDVMTYKKELKQIKQRLEAMNYKTEKPLVIHTEGKTIRLCSVEIMPSEIQDSTLKNIAAQAMLKQVKEYIKHDISILPNGDKQCVSTVHIVKIAED